MAIGSVAHAWWHSAQKASSQIEQWSEVNRRFLMGSALAQSLSDGAPETQELMPHQDALSRVECSRNAAQAEALSMLAEAGADLEPMHCGAGA